MEQTSNKRRNFLLALGLSAAAGVAALFAGKRPVVAEVVAQDATQPQATKGYHESEHVKRYYRTTRV